MTSLAPAMLACTTSDETSDGDTAEVAEAAASASPITSGYAGKCLGDAGGNTANGNPIDLFTCNGTSAENWLYTGGTFVGPGNKCLDIVSDNQVPGAAIDLYTCNGTNAQKWTVSGTSIKSTAGLCLDVKNDVDADGTLIQLATCKDLAAQVWHVGATAPNAPTATLSASPSSIAAGGSAKLTWSSSNATSCTASGSWSGTLATSGSRTVSPSETSSYALSCTGAGGKATASATVTVGGSGGGNSTGGCGTNDNLWVYHAGTFYWGGDFDGPGAPANYDDTSGDPVYGKTDVKINMEAQYGFWLPWAIGYDESIAGCNYLTLHLKYTGTDPQWSMWTVLIHDKKSAGPGAILSDYYQPTAAHPSPVANTWGYYKVPLTQLYCPPGVTNLHDARCTSSSTVYKFGIQDHTNIDPWFVEEVVFTAD